MPARPVSSGRSTRCSGAGMRSPGSTFRRSRSRRSRRGARARSSSPAWTYPQRDSSLLSGEAGVLLVAWSLTERPDLADDLYARVRANVHADELDELMWGTAGTLLIARELLARTGEERWREACRESAEALLARRDADGLWTQRLFKDTRSLGPVHGLVGNVHALRTTLDPERAERLEAETNEVLSRLAVREDGLANWPPSAGDGMEHARTGAIRLQWCHGAPGIVATTAPYLDEELVLAGAELTWRAGAHREQKGAGICHGTAGNGYALLAAFDRTGDELWLDRARRFAVHALRPGGARGAALLRSGWVRSAPPSSRRTASTGGAATPSSSPGTGSDAPPAPPSPRPAAQGAASAGSRGRSSERRGRR